MSNSPLFQSPAPFTAACDALYCGLFLLPSGRFSWRRWLGPIRLPQQGHSLGPAAARLFVQNRLSIVNLLATAAAGGRPALKYLEALDLDDPWPGRPDHRSDLTVLYFHRPLKWNTNTVDVTRAMHNTQRVVFSLMITSLLSSGPHLLTRDEQNYTAKIYHKDIYIYIYLYIYIHTMKNWKKRNYLKAIN